MDLRTFLQILWRRKWVIGITLGVAIAIAVAGTLIATPIYAATTTLRVATSASGSIDQIRYDISHADRLMNTYVGIATSAPVLHTLAERLNRAQPPVVRVEIPANTEFIRIRAEDPDPEQAARIASTLATILIEQIDQAHTQSEQHMQTILGEQIATAEAGLLQARGEYEQLLTRTPESSEQRLAARNTLTLKEASYARLIEQYDRARIAQALQSHPIALVEPALVPTAPVRPRPEVTIPLAALLGIVAGLGLAFISENLDTRLHTPAQIEQAIPLTILGQIPSAREQAQLPIFNGNSPQEVAFRHLRTTILSLQRSAPLQTLLISSTAPEEGTSTAVSNLAVALAQSGRRVAVIDANLRQPTLHQFFELPNTFGLSSVLQHEMSLEDALQQSRVPGISVLTSGSLPAHPADLLASPDVALVIKQLAHQYDLVLFDTPALQGAPDAVILAPMVHGVILMMRSAHTRYDLMQAAYRQLTRVRARILGIVVNHDVSTGAYSRAGDQIPA